MSHNPLILDLDGTTISSDTTYELCLMHLKVRGLLAIFDLVIWFSTNRALAKDKLVALYFNDFDVVHLPYTDLMQQPVMKTAPSRGLVSGSHDTLVKKVGEHLGGFDLVQGTTVDRNLIGTDKAAYLIEQFPDGFDYIGDSSADIVVWQAAKQAYAYNATPQTISKALEAGVALEVLSTRRRPWHALRKGMRLHQWSKNGLLAVIPFLNIAQFQAIWTLWIALAFIGFGLVASATYLFNDLLDIQADRQHCNKRHRPFASGGLDIPIGIYSIIVLTTLGFGLALLLDPKFAGMLVIYTGVSLFYSFTLKQIALLDAFVLSFLFCWRILAGGIVIGNFANSWFMIAIGFFFLGLAFGKRAIELGTKKDVSVQLAGRGYYPQDYVIVFSAGLASSFTCVVIVLIYSLLSRSAIIVNEISAVLLAGVLLFWQLRFWLLVCRDKVHDDPVVFALKDRVSALILLCLLAIVVYEQL